MRRVALVALFVCVLALLASTANGILFAIGRRAEFVALFPGAVGPLYAAQLATAALGIVSLVGVALLRWWGFWSFLAMSLIALVLDLLTQAPSLHLVAVSVSSTIVLALAYVTRSCFEGRAGSA